MGLVQFAEDNRIEAGVVVTCVGSLEQYNLRFANQKEGQLKMGFFEILSLTGTISLHGVHLHLPIADAHGQTVGGHLQEGNLVYTTAEIAVAQLHELKFLREIDPRYGYRELKVEPNKP
jgi:predicted DNA-binding protein with PD1-like motif